MSAELHRLVPLTAIGAERTEIRIEANAAECAALAERMQIPAVPAFACVFQLRRAPGRVVAAEGRLEARLVRTCVLTLDDFETTVAEDFALRFVPEGSESDDPDPESLDEVPYADGVLDLGEAAAEQLALALDPYPHKPGAELPESEPDEAERPFAGLAGLRRHH
jgi:uncharacterized metal-binding protein YceD (DUF177 family)